MSDQQDPQEQEEEPPANSDSAAVQAALKGIPGLADAVGNRPAAPAGSDSMSRMLSEEGEEEEPAFGTPKPEVEDSETVQRALKQLGLQ